MITVVQAKDEIVNFSGMADISTNVLKNGTNFGKIIIPINILLNGLSCLLARLIVKELDRHHGVFWDILSNEFVQKFIATSIALPGNCISIRSCRKHSFLGQGIKDNCTLSI